MDAKLSEIKKLYEEAFKKLNGKSEIPEIKVGFYPYIGINHTIRARGGKIYVRIAEICRDLPLEAQSALSEILVSKLLRKKIPQQTRQIYRNFIKNTELREKALNNKRLLGRKIIGSAEGDVYNLTEIFRHLNQIYFDEKISEPTISWSARKTYRILGHHDSTHETIIVSKSLDDKSVPKYVVEYVVYHEMLHIFHPTEHRNGRRYNHTPQFRRDERKFAFFDEAENWIEQNVKHLKRKAKAQISKSRKAKNK